MPLPDDPRRVYLDTEPPVDERRLRKHRLVDAVKRIIEETALVDVDEADLDALDALTTEAQVLADRLSSLPSLRRFGGMASAGDQNAALVERSGFSGRSNPLAPPLHITHEGDRLRAWAVWTAAYEGPNHCLHGGYVAAAFDDLLGMAQMLSGAAGFTGTLTVKMLRPTPLHERIDYEAGFDRREGRKIWCWGKSWHGRELLSECSIVFIAPRDGALPNDVQLRVPQPRQGERGDGAADRQ